MIGDGCSAIKISGNLNYWQGPDTSESVLTIGVKRGSTIVKEKAADTSKKGLLSLSVSPFVANVQKGDVVVMETSSGTTGAYIIIGRSVNTYLTVEKIY